MTVCSKAYDMDEATGGDVPINVYVSMFSATVKTKLTKVAVICQWGNYTLSTATL